MKLSRTILLLAATFGAATLAPAASASVSLGDTITCSASSGGGFCSSGSAAVGTGSEFTGSGLLTFDFSKDLLTIGNTLNAGDMASFGPAIGFVTFQNETAGFTAATFLSSTLANFTANNVSVTSRGLVLDLREVGFVSGSTATISLGATTDPASAVPEPATWAMLVLGFGMVGAAMRRRARVLAC